MSQTLAGRLDSVVAVTATADDIGMIENRRNPCIGSMAVVTVVATRKMRRSFTRRDDIVMTRHTSSDDLCMVYRNSRLPERGVVTVLTGIRRLNMRHVFAGCFVAVMTVETISNIISVIKYGRNPGDRLMAVVAGLA